MSLEQFLSEDKATESNDLVVISNEIIKLENELKIYKEIEKKRDELKEQLLKAMQQNNLSKWETNNGTKITLVEGYPDIEVEETYYDELRFMNDNPELHEAYHNKLAEYKKTRIKVQKGRKDYLKITLPKGE